MADNNADLKKIIHLLEQSVTLQAIALRKDFENKGEFIVALSHAGFENATIAQLLGDTTDSVRSAVNRARRRSS